MKNYLKILIFIALFLGIGSIEQRKVLQLQHVEASDFTWFKVATFDKQDNKTDLGENISLWKGKAESCAFEYTDKEKDSSASKGYSLKVTYNVDADKDGSTGIKIDLKMLDLTKGHYNVVFLVKGDKTAGYTTRFKVKLESPGKEAIQIANDVIGEWKQIYLPFSMFKGDIDWKKVNSMYIIFDKDTVTEKKGIIYIDAIFLN